MARVKAFRGLRPPVEIAEQLASRPYDVMNSAEARVEAAGNQCLQTKRLVGKRGQTKVVYLCPNNGRTYSIWYCGLYSRR